MFFGKSPFLIVWMTLTSEETFELKLLFLRALADGYRRARAAQERLLHAPNDSSAAEQLRDFFHRIAGTAHAVQFNLLGYSASICERVAGGLSRGTGMSVTDSMQLLADGLAGVATVLDEFASGQSERPLPRSGEDLAGLALPEAVSEGRELSKILVIDDDRFSAALIDNCLRSAGFMSSYCCDPRRALTMIEEELPDLIVMDVVMPEVDGFELCRRVRQHPAMQFTPIIFVTRKGDVEQRVRGLEVGGNDYIAKPFEPRELVARVRSHLLRLANLREMAIRDGLTRCFNHKYLRMRLDQEVSRARRYTHPLAFAMLDADNFKTVNDTWGHATGDLVLVQLANVVAASLRTTDVVARYGGEEFALIMVHAGVKEAELVCGRIRERVAAHQFLVSGDKQDERIPVTVSIGIAEFAQKTDSWKSLIQRADQALYAAKEAGRNKVRIARNT